MARLYAFFVIMVGVLLAAPSDHDNYALWWTPVLVILLATLGAQPRPPVTA
jgi:cytochrome c-type biogenesis protein CcmH/NrfF